MNEKRDSLKVIYQDDALVLVLGEAGGKTYLLLDQVSCRLDDYRLEPCLYIKTSAGKHLTIHHSITVEELCHAARTNGSIRMITGNEYGVRDIFRLIRKAVELSNESVDIDYLEGQLFMEYMREHGAFSPETAVDLSAAGMQNPKMMYPFIHSRKVGETPEGLFYLRKTGEKYFRLISNQVRFGCGYRQQDGRRQFYAWHGYPNRNDDFITYAEISEREFQAIEMEYPCEFSADRETAEVFRRKYVDGHPVIREGWNVSV